jgi:hypothetical protein
MASEDYSKNGLLTYLRESARSGILNPAVARSRKIAAVHLLDHIESEERLNLRLLDVDHLCSKIHKLEDSSIRVEALDLYNSRLKSALEDYFNYLDDPENFVSTAIKQPNTKIQKRKDCQEQKALEDITLLQTDKQEEIIPIKIRQDLTVFIKDLPMDLSKSEAKKITRVVMAYIEGEE